MLVLIGVLLVIVGFAIRLNPLLVVTISGIVTALLGLIILIQWPFSSLFALGIILGIDLIQAGMSWLNLGLFLKRRAAH
jgi:uncharacterized membrane protein HdeD (DUF308 family)